MHGKTLVIVIGSSAVATGLLAFSLSYEDSSPRTPKESKPVERIVVSKPVPNSAFTPQVLTPASRERLAKLRDVHTGKVIDLADMSVAAFVDKWSPAARRGDAQAAFAVYQVEARCAQNDEQSSLLTRYRTQHTLPETEQTELENNNRQVAEICEGITPRQKQERFDFLATSARAGIAQAGVAYYMEGPPFVYSGDLAQSTDPSVLTWKAAALSYLKESADAGVPYALQLLAMAYSKGGLATTDDKLALTYAYANTSLKASEPDNTPYIKSLMSKLSVADSEEAKASGLVLAKRCCSQSMRR